MEELTTKEIKDISLEILQDFHRFCIIHKLKYSLFYGSLIGAVRHNGYIPWDDDIDIAMPRNDYDYLINMYESKKYGIQCCENNSSYFLPWAKMYDKNTLKIEPVRTKKKFEIGINIDIFPLDYVESEEELNETLKKRNKISKKLIKSLYEKANASNRIKMVLKKMYLSILRFNQHNYSCKLNNSVRNNHKNRNNNYFVGIDIGDVKLIYPITTFDNLVLSPFEGNNYFITKDYDLILKSVYGDYMEFPPENERITHHNFKAFRK